MTDRPAPLLAIPRGSVLFAPGQDCSGFVVVHAGTVRVSLTAGNGREIVLYRVRPGDVCLQTFGCLIKHQPYAAEGVAETDLSLEIVPASAFEQRVAADPGFRRQLFAAVAARFADMERLVEDVALTGLDARLARWLLRHADPAGRIATTHEALAAEIGSGRAAVSRALAGLVRARLVELSRGSIRLADRGALAARARALD